MRFKRYCAALAAVLVLGLVGTAVAETVPGAVYGDTSAPGHNMPTTKVIEQLRFYGVQDLSSTHVAAGSIAVLLQAGLLTPSASGTINPDSGVSAGQGVAIFAKALGFASKLDSVETALAKAKAAGFAPASTSGSAPLSRVEIARMLAKSLGVTPQYGVSAPFNDVGGLSADDVAILAALRAAGLFRGYPDGSFGVGNTLTTAEVAMLIDRLMGAGKAS